MHIKMILEILKTMLRMRRAFGTISYIDQNDNIKPLDMSIANRL
jgi:hypothetical protein